MFLNFIALLTALSISGVAAYYSIYGLTAIFSGVFLPIVIMGGVLEVGKIVTTVWLHTYWRDLKIFLKLYMSIAVVVLMFITSMGIFGFLSRAHIEVTSQAGGGELLIQQVELSIATEQKRIDDARAVMKQMDDAITGLLKGSGANAERDNNRTATMTTQATKLRESQKKERDALNKSIDESNKRIAELSKEKLKLKQEDLKLQAEVGPVKYIAQLIYDDELPGQSILEKAVRWVIIIIVAVFDPLAVAMVLGVTMVMNKRREEKAATKAALHDTMVEVERIIEKEVERLVVDPALIKRADRAEQELAEALVMLEEAKNQEPVVVERIVEVPTDKIIEVERIVEIEKPIEVIKEVEVIKEIEKPIEVIREVKVEDTAKLEELESEIKNLLRELEQKDRLLAERAVIEVDGTANAPIPTATEATNSILPELDEMLAIRADGISSVLPVKFGSEYPQSAQKGQMFLKLDVMPSQLYKFNGNKWIMVDKDQNASYTADAKVIQALINRLQSGETEWDDLTASEQDALPESIRKNYSA